MRRFGNTSKDIRPKKSRYLPLNKCYRMEYQFTKIHKVLVANRGEIAVRCIRACRKVSIKSVSIYTESDATSLHASSADENVPLSGDNANGYLDT